jgi:hypothetical protein
LELGLTLQQGRYLRFPSLFSNPAKGALPLFSRIFYFSVASVKNELYMYFKNHQITLDAIIGAFKTIHLTVDPKISMQYDSEQNTLDYHLWSLFFALCGDDGNRFCIPIPPWKLGGEIVHEFDHYLFLKEHDMIGKVKDKADEFKEKNLAEIEKRASSQQIIFLKNCRKNVPLATLTYKIMNLRWKINKF